MHKRRTTHARSTVDAGLTTILGLQQRVHARLCVLGCVMRAARHDFTAMHDTASRGHHNEVGERSRVVLDVVGLAMCQDISWIENWQDRSIDERHEEFFDSLNKRNET